MRNILLQVSQGMREMFRKDPILIIPAVVLSFTLILIAGYALLELSHTWEKIPPPPARPQRLLGIVNTKELYILASDGKVYGLPFTSSYDTLWSEFIYKDGFGLERPACKLNTIKFFSWKRPFSGTFECLEIQPSGEFISPPLVTIVLDQNGTIWLYRQSHYEVCLLGPVGFLVAILLFSIQRRKIKVTRSSVIMSRLGD